MLYRQTPKRSWLARLRARVLGPRAEERGARAAQRAPVMLRIFRDIPVPSWRIVFPEKLLQFRPLDGLRADLITVAGACCPRSAPGYAAASRRAEQARARRRAGLCGGGQVRLAAAGHHLLRVRVRAADAHRARLPPHVAEARRFCTVWVRSP